MKTLALVLGVFAMIFAILALVAFPVMWLWDATLPELTGAKEIGYWQALGLMVLARLIFAPIEYKAKSNARP